MKPVIIVLGLVASTQAFAQHVIVYEDYAGYSMAGIAAVNLGLTAADYINDGPGFAAAAAGADVLVVESSNWYPGIDVENAIADAISQGKPVIVGHWAFQQDPGYNLALGISPTDYYTPVDHYVHPGAVVDFFDSFGGTLHEQGDPIFGVDGSTFTLTGAGWLAGDSSIGATIAVTNNDRSIANGWLTFDYQGVDSDLDGTDDAVELLENELIYLLSLPPVFRMSATGSCPGPVTFTISNGTPFGDFQAMRSRNTGQLRIPFGACAGTRTRMGVGRILDLGVHPLDGSGGFSRTFTLNHCGTYYQVMDLATCQTTGTVFK